MTLLSQLYPGDQFMLLVAAVIAQVAVVVVLGLVLTRFPRRRSAAVRSAIWLAALGCVLLAPVLACGFGIANVQFVRLPFLARAEPETKPRLPMRASQGRAAPATAAPAAATPWSQPAKHAEEPNDQDGRVPVSDVPPQAIKSASPSSEPTSSAGVDWWRAAAVCGLLLWVAGASVFAVRFLYGCLVLKRLRAGARPVDERTVVAMHQDVCRVLGIRRYPQVMASPHVAAPIATSGLRGPMVILPDKLLSRLNDHQLRHVLMHECAHLRQRDILLGISQRIAQLIYWPHPLVHLLNRALTRAREGICDNYVLRQGDAPAYARTLVHLSTALPYLGTPIAACGMFDPVSQLETRIEELLDDRRDLMTRTKRSLLLTVGLLFLGISVLSFGSKLVEAAGPDRAAEAPNRKGEEGADDERADDPLPAGSTLRFGTSRFRHGIPVSAMAVSADGRIAIVANDNHMLGHSRVFDLDSGRVLYSLQNLGNIETAAISPDGRTIVTKQSFSLRIRDAATGKELRKIQLERANSYSRNEWVAFTPDGKAIAVTSQGKVIHLIDFETGRTIRDFSNDNPESSLGKSFSSVLGIAFSQDGKLMASGGFANDQGTYFARLWDVDTGREIRRFMHTRRSYGVRSLAFSPDAKTLATRSHDGRLRLFDVDTGRELKTFPKDGRGRRPGTVAFAPDGRTVAAAGDSIRLYDVATGEERLRIDRKQASHLQFTDGGKTLMGAVMGAIYRWDAATGKSLTPEAGDSIVEQILVTPDGSRVVTRGQRGDVHIWDGANGRHLRRFGETVWQQDLAMSPDGRLLAWLVEDHSIRIPDPPRRVVYSGSRILFYDIAADRLVDSFPGFKGDAGDLMFTGNGKKLITVGHRDGVVRIWDFESGREERSFQAVPDDEKDQPRQVTHTALSPDGRTLAVAYHPLEDSTLDEKGRLITARRLASTPRPVRLWDVATGKEQRQLKGGHGAMAFSPDSRFFVTASGAVLETATGNRVAALPAEPYIRAISYSRDGRFLATAVAGGAVQVWDVATWTKRHEFKGHRDRVTTLTFAPGGRLLSGSLDTTVLAWDLPQ